MERSLSGLFAAQRALAERFDDFRGALGRRDEAAYKFALADFERCLVRWSHVQEEALLPAIERAGISGRDAKRELHLEWIQLRELTRILMSLVGDHDKLADTLGIAENLGRRLAAHREGLESVYFPAAAPALTADEWNSLSEAAPD